MQGPLARPAAHRLPSCPGLSHLTLNQNGLWLVYPPAWQGAPEARPGPHRGAGSAQGTHPGLQPPCWSLLPYLAHTHRAFSPSWAWAGPGMGGNAPDIWEALATPSRACLFGEMHLLPHMEPGGGSTCWPCHQSCVFTGWPAREQVPIPRPWGRRPLRGRGPMPLLSSELLLIASVLTVWAATS